MLVLSLDLDGTPARRRGRHVKIGHGAFNNKRVQGIWGITVAWDRLFNDFGLLDNPNCYDDFDGKPLLHKVVDPWVGKVTYPNLKIAVNEANLRLSEAAQRLVM